MNGTQAIEFHRLLKKYKFNDQDADKFMEFVENRGGELVTKKDLEPLKKDINWLKWVMGIGLTLLTALVIGALGAVYYLHNDTKTVVKEMEKNMQGMKVDIEGMKAEMKAIKAEMKGMKTDIKEIKALIKSK